MVIARGELWWADLGLPRGSAPALRRPVVIISDDRFNASRIATITVAVVTSNGKLGVLPGNVTLDQELSGLDRTSVVNVTAIATVDRTCLEARITRLPDWVLAQIDEGLRLALSL